MACVGINFEKKVNIKGKDKVIKSLNHLLTEEFNAINHYMLHGEMCDN